ncbi:MAG: riboflavin synthase [Alphaproteobacteria bacterium]|nr:riboflavin synthase [Alphaproteobacteria bacterium]
MFTGIITDIGELVERDGGRFVIASLFDPETIALGASVACDGCCLTVTKIDAAETGAQFEVDVSNETLAKTTLDGWKVGQKMNLERALRAGDELGGHLVTGHVDGVAKIVSIEPDGDSQRFEFEVADDLARFVATKGSVALDGTSLTVNSVVDRRFTINLIPHTLTQTMWGRKKSGEVVNIEIDIFARYVARMMEFNR